MGDGEYAGLVRAAAAATTATAAAAAGGIADPRIPPPLSSSYCSYSSRVEFWSLMGANAGGSRSGPETGGNAWGGSAEGRRRGGRPPLLSVLRGRVAGAAPAVGGGGTAGAASFLGGVTDDDYKGARIEDDAGGVGDGPLYRLVCMGNNLAAIAGEASSSSSCSSA